MQYSTWVVQIRLERTNRKTKLLKMPHNIVFLTVTDKTKNIAKLFHHYTRNAMAKK